MARETIPFQLVGGHQVLDFVNTLDNRFAKGGPDELLAEFGDLLRFASQSGLLSAEEINQAAQAGTRSSQREALQLARRVREYFASVLYKVVDDRGDAQGIRAHGLAPVNLAEVSALIRASGSVRTLNWAGGATNGKMTWAWTGMEGDLAVNKLVTSFADLVTSEKLALVRKCGSPTCQWLFLQTAKTKGRRWCDMKVCGNRMKVQRYRSRSHAPGLSS